MIKRMLATLLCAGMAISLFAGLTPAAYAAAGTYKRTELEKVIADTAIAYYLKGPDCQYDSSTLSGNNRWITGNQRQTLNRSPEECSPQRRYYTVCSSFPNDVYYDVFGTNPLSPSDMAGSDLTGASRTAELTGLSVENLTDDDLEFPLALIPLTANFCAYGKKVAWLGGDDYEQGWIGHDGVVFFWGGNSFEDVTDAQLQDMEDNLRPGDIIAVVRGDEEDEDGENGGHTMVFLGDYKGDGTRYLIHSGGHKYNTGDASFTGRLKSSGASTYALRPGVITEDGTATGATAIGYDCVEDSSTNTRNGTIRINPFKDSIARGKTYGPKKSGSSVVKQFVVIRPIDRLIDWHGAKGTVSDNDLFPKKLTLNGYARLQYPGLEITTVADKNEYQAVKAGDTITYSWIVENDTNIKTMGNRYLHSDGTVGKIYSNMKLILPLPANTTYESYNITNTATTVVNGTTTYDEGTHTLTVDGFMNTRGRMFRVDVTVRVLSAAKPGDRITLPKGRLTGPWTESYFTLAGMTHTVCGEQPSGFESITASSVTSSGGRTLMDAANDVYAALGYRLELPSTQRLLNSILTYAYQPLDTSSGHWMQSRLLDESEITDPDALLLRKMVVPGYIGGHKLFTPNAAGVRTNRTRMLDFNEDYLQPGDILVYAYVGTSENSGRTISSRSSSVVDPERVYVYLGDSNYAYYDYDGTFRVINAPLRTFLYDSSRARGELTGFDRNGNSPYTAYSRYEWSAVLTQAFRYSYFFCLRPSLAYATIPTMTPSASAAYTVTNGGATTGYSSLAAAITAANASAGSTLTMHENATLSANQTFTGGTLDLGGYKLTTGAYTLTLGSGSTSQTLRNGRVIGTGEPVFCADSSSTNIENVKIFGGTNGAALGASDTATVTLESAALASAKTDALPVFTPSGSQSNWTFANDVTVLVPTEQAPYDGNGAALCEGVSCYSYGKEAYYQISNAGSAATYLPVVFTKDPSARNEMKGVFYASLSEAIAEASAGDTITLLRDVHTGDLNETGNYSGYGRLVDPSSTNKRYTYHVGKTLTIDYNGFTLYSDGSGSINSTAFFISGNNPITFRNGTLYTTGDWALNLVGKELHLDHMKVLGTAVTLLAISDSSQIDRMLYAENGTLIIGGLYGYSSANVAIDLRHGTVVVRGGSRIGSLTGVAIKPSANKATAESPNTSKVIVEDGSLFTGRYAYRNRDSSFGFFDTTPSPKYNAILTFLADSDPEHYLREEHREEILDIPGSKAIIAVDRTVRRSGAATNETTGTSYETLKAALEAAEPGQTILLNGAYTMSADAAVPTGVTLDLDTYTLTVPDGVTLNAESGTVTAAEDGKLVTAGTVLCSAEASKRLPGTQVRLEGSGSYGGVTIPKGMDASGKTVIPDLDMNRLQSLNLRDRIGINHYLADGKGQYTGASYALVDGVPTAMHREGENLYLPVYKSAAWEMGRESTVQVVCVDSEGRYCIGKPSRLSIREYAQTLLSETDWKNSDEAKLGRAMIGLLNYGAAAQNYFGYETGDLANKNLTSADQARMYYTAANIGKYRVNKRSTVDPEQLYYASSCVLGDGMALRFYLYLPDDRTDRENLQFCTEYRSYNGEVRQATAGFADLTATTVSGVYYFEVPNMAAADVKTEVTLTVKRAESTIATVTDSITSYCARAHDSAPEAAELADAMLIYGLSARDYFAKLEPSPEDNEMPIS